MKKAQQTISKELITKIVKELLDSELFEGLILEFYEDETGIWLNWNTEERKNLLKEVKKELCLEILRELMA